MNFDGTYKEPAPDDPIAGVVMTHFEADPLERTATVVFTRFRKSGAVAGTDSVALKAEEFDKFAVTVWPTLDFGKACVAALSYRLPNVSSAPSSPAAPAVPAV